MRFFASEYATETIHREGERDSAMSMISMTTGSKRKECVCMTSIQTQGDALRLCSLSLPNHRAAMEWEFLVGTWRLIDYWIEPWEEYLWGNQEEWNGGMELWENGSIGYGNAMYTLNMGR